MILAHVIALDPTYRQANQFARAAGVSRFTYNWALAEWERQYQAGEKPNARALKKQFNQIKREQFPWVVESHRDANSQAFADLGTAYKNFFASVKGKRKGNKVGRPQFKRKGRNDSFYVANDKFHFAPDNKHVVLPVIGSVKIKESLRLRGKIRCGRIRKRAGRWFLAVQIDVGDCQRETPLIRNDVVGVDLGIITAVTTSKGQCFEAPKPLKTALKQLRRANRRLHRRKKGGCNRKKAQLYLSRVHERVACVRKDFFHKITTILCRENQSVVIEDLNVQSMGKGKNGKHDWYRAARDVGLGAFKPMMTYKSEIYSSKLVIADRYFPSSKRCSRCGNVKTKLELSDRIYHCDVCGLEIDRDLNAGLNLEMYPRLRGEFTPMEITASTEGLPSASRVAEVGTKPCALVHTI